MRITTRKREESRRGPVIWLCILVMGIMLTGCGNMTSYEGGNISVSYDKNKYDLVQYNTAEYAIFELQAEENDVIFMAVENNGSMIEHFHDSITGMVGMECDVEMVDTVDRWDDKAVLYYTDLLSGTEDGENGYMISYGKVQDDWLLLAIAEFPAESSGGQNETEKQEVLQILDSLKYSSEAEVADEVEENESLQYLADVILSLKKYEADLESAEGQDDEKSAPAGDVNTNAARMISDEEAVSLQYMEKVMIEDYYGDMAEYEMYAPVGSENEDGFLSYIDHGLYFSASVFDGGSKAVLYEFLDGSVELQEEDWQNDDRFSDIEISEIVANGDDRYLIASAQGKDYNGTPYDQNRIFYLDVQDDGVGIFWELEITEFEIDEETDLIVDEIAKCYGISLEGLAVSGEWAKKDAQHEMEIQDVYEPEDGELVLTKVDGYQYLGSATLSFRDGEIQCPAMAPMGRSTEVKEDGISSSMHGVSVYVGAYQSISKSYLAELDDDAERSYRSTIDSEGKNKNVERSEVMTMEGFDEGLYYIIEYDRLDHKGENYYKQVDVRCYIRLDEKFFLSCNIWLRDNEYDDSTNILLKELETAYGIDLSKYYYEG